MSSYLGQNFLTDQSVLEHIAQQVQELFSSTNCKTLIEIGPGKGALTHRIQNLTQQTLLIEYDEKMIAHLQKTKLLSGHTQIIHQDILQRDEHNVGHSGLIPESSIDKDSETNSQISMHKDSESSSEGQVKKTGRTIQKNKTLVVGNIPYYITSPILRKFFETQTPTRAGGVFLIQKEAAEKIVHNAPKKSFLRWLINYAYKIEHCFDVPPTSFTPPPKVTSTVIRVRPKALNTIPELDYTKLIQFLDLYSPYKRKTLGASSKIVAKHQSKNNNPDAIVFDITDFSSQRLEELGWEEMKRILG